MSEVAGVPVLLDLDDLCAILGVSRWTIHKWRQLGEGPRAVKVGRLLRWTPAEVRRWIAERTELP